MASQLLTPTDATWDAERGAFNVLLDQQPAGIAVPDSADDVVEIVRAAAADGMRVAAQRTGHSAAPLGSLAETVLVRTGGLGGVEIDAGAGRGRVGAGALWGDFVPAASEHGLAALHGSTPTVGIAGYSLGGGVSFYGRKHGLACNRVSAIELVTADAELRRVDAANDPDLFWALRGGGGSFGVVTALEFDLLELPEVFAGALFFPAERAGEVLHAWHEWTATVPEEVTSVGRLMNFPPIPEIPEPFRGKSFAVVEVIHCGDSAEGEELVAPLRALGPEMDTIAAVHPGGHHRPPHGSARALALLRHLTADRGAAGGGDRRDAGRDRPRLRLATGRGRAAALRRRLLASAGGGRSPRHPARVLPRLRRRHGPGPGGDGADARLAGEL